MLTVRRSVYLLYRAATAAQYRVQRRLTRPGLTMLGGVVVTGLLGLDIYGSVAYQAFLMILCVLGGSLAWAWRFRMKFTAARSLPRFGTVGLPLTYHITLRNESGLPQKGLVVMENLADPRPNFAEFVAIQQADQRHMRSFSVFRHFSGWTFDKARVKEEIVPPMEPGQSVEVSLVLTPVSRGHVRLTGLTMARPDPLGLIKAYACLDLPHSLLVLPRRYPLPPLPLPGTMKYQPGGVAQASSVGESEEFISLRDYRAGDPLRRIHWRSWARAGRPIVKEYADEFFVRHALILDTFGDHPRSEVFEEAVSVAASFACTIQTQESLLDLLFVESQAYCFTSGRGLAHTDQMLEILASVRVCADKPFDTLENLVLHHISAVSGCVCVLVAWDERRQQFISRLKMLGVPLRVLLIKQAGGAAPDPGPLRDEPENFHVLEVGAIAEGLAQI
jgi:uncharacterized protein (DUF58 family)